MHPPPSESREHQGAPILMFINTIIEEYNNCIIQAVRYDRVCRFLASRKLLLVRLR